MYVIKMKNEDNVAVAVKDIPNGTKIDENLTALNDIPQAHKIALVDMTKGDAVMRYGVVLGYVNRDVKKGEWINEHMLELPTPPDLDEMQYATNIVTDLPKPNRTTWMGYKNSHTDFGGTRNILAIHTTVQCVTGVLNVAIERIRKELLPKYPNVDAVVPINHSYGCGVAIDAPEAKVPIRTLHNLVKHPNFGGEVMVVALGCEKLTLERLLDKEDNIEENTITLQNCNGFDDMIKTIMDMADKKLANLDKRRREELPLSSLFVGAQCGGSDAFSGIAGNTAVGYASDLLVSGGATVMFSEVTEVRDGVYLIAERCLDEKIGKRLADEMRWYDNYLAMGGVGRDANTTPGNKQGGLSNIVEKAMGSIAKSGTAPICEVLSPAEIPTKRGLIFGATPASDLVCGTSQLASGIGVQVFVTGRGTPYGLAATPVLKICTRNEMKEKWSDIIDINAGPIGTGEATIEEIGEDIFDYILDVASGLKQPYTEKYGIHNDLCIFNPAPIT